MRWAALAALLMIFPTVPAWALQVDVLRQTGPADRRFNLVVLGDGYRASDQAQLNSDAKKLIDYLLGISPFKEYAAFFNVKLIHVISVERGADGGDYGANRNTALDSAYNGRLLCASTAKAMSIAAEETPEYNFAIVIVNDTAYGGCGSSVPTSSINSQSFEILAHEVGHGLAGLADEYAFGGSDGWPRCPRDDDCSEPNVTVRTTRESIKWKHWIDPATPIPTPQAEQYSDVVGLFEGAAYWETDQYRPWLHCKMREFDNPFCPVCTEQWVLRYWNFENVRMIEDAAPAANFKVESCDPIVLSVTNPPITPSTYKYTWTVDGASHPETSSKLSLMPATLGHGNHEVELLVEDKTSFVRKDPQKFLSDTHSWSLQVTRDDCSVSTGGAGGTGGRDATSNGGTIGNGGGTSAGGHVAANGGSGNNTNVAGSSAAGSSGSNQKRPPPPTQEDAGCSCELASRTHDERLTSWFILALGVRVLRRRRTL